MLHLPEPTAPSFDEAVWDEADWNLWSLVDRRTLNSTRFYTLLLYAVARSQRLTELVELGGFQGNTSQVLAHAAQQNNGRLTIYEHDPAHALAIRQRLVTYPVRVITGTSLEPAPDQADPDLVFVDGDHRYEGISGDWQVWHPRIQPNGYMACHDIQTPDVGRWVHQTFPRSGWEPFILPNDCGLLLLRRIP